jgi:hypothetical protein
LPSIILGPTVNIQGTYKLLNLATGKKIKQSNFTKYPMPTSIITRVETLGRLAHNDAFNFSDQNGILFKWNEDINSDEGLIVEDDNTPYPAFIAKFPGVTLEGDLPDPRSKLR